MTESLKPTTINSTTIQNWHKMAAEIQKESSDQGDEMVSFLASMLTTHLHERVGEQQVQELLAKEQKTP